MEQQLGKIKTYDFGESRAALTEFSDQIRKAYGKPEEVKKYEAALIDVLKSDAKYAGKQYACRELSIIGTDAAVPVLTGMLTNQEYSDMARYALERIPGEATNKALCEALAKADGKAKIGIVNSLGERGCTAATADIAKCTAGSDKMLCEAAVAALGKIGNADCVTALNKTLQSAPDNQKTPVYDALLKAAEKTLSRGDKAGALKIYVALNQQSVPKLIRTAAINGIANASKTK